MYSIHDIKPYVYSGTHKTTKRFYIGVRYGNVRTKTSVFDDFGKKYRTSCKEVKPIFNEFDWTILKLFDNFESALEYEDSLINENWGNPLLINKNRGGKKFRRPDNYIRGPKRETKILGDRSSYYKKKWRDPEYRANQLSKINANRGKRDSNWKQKHSQIMKDASRKSKSICRVCRLSDRKEMTVQNFYRYLKL